MVEPAWREQPRPTVSPGATLLFRGEPRTPADLTAHRLAVSAALHDAARPPQADEGAVERLLLAFEELVSNGLRHGTPPVTVEITQFDHFWLLDVGDQAADRPPALAVGRDAALGGLGLHLVAQICGAYGWTVEGERKHVWGRIDYTRAEPPGHLPHPRPSGDAVG